MAPEPDKHIDGKGFTVEIAGHGLLAVKGWRGGKPLAGAKSKHGDATPGQSSISELELVVFVTADHNHLADIVKKVGAGGEPYYVDITITQGKDTDSKRFTYHDCYVRIALVHDPKTGAMAYGKHTYEDMSFTVRVTDEPKSDAAFVQDWFQQATQKGGEGGGVRRDISVFLYARDKSTLLRTYHAKECFPTSLDAGDHGKASEAKTVTLRTQPTRVELA